MWTKLASCVGGNGRLLGGMTVLLVLVLCLVYCTGRKDGKQGEVVEQQKRELEVQGKLGQAAGKAANQRLNDAVQTAQERKELDDALKATEGSDRQRALRGCVILRQQGRDTSRIPACAGFAGRP